MERLNQRLSEIHGETVAISEAISQKSHVQSRSETCDKLLWFTHNRSDVTKSVLPHQNASVVINSKEESEPDCSSEPTRDEFTHQVFDEMHQQKQRITHMSCSENKEALTRNDDSKIVGKIPKQIGSMRQYYDSFITFINQLQISQEYALTCFLEGLKEDIQIKVRMFNPTTLYHAYCLAKLEEAVLESILRSQSLEVAMNSNKVEEVESNDALEKVHMESFRTETMSIWNGSSNEEKVVKKIGGDGCPNYKELEVNEVKQTEVDKKMLDGVSIEAKRGHYHGLITTSIKGRESASFEKNDKTEGTAVNAISNKKASSDSGKEEQEDQQKEKGSISNERKRLQCWMKIAELRQICSRPDVVEVGDATSADPKLLVFLKSYCKTVLVLRHWCPTKKIIHAYVEKKDSKKLKQKQRTKSENCSVCVESNLAYVFGKWVFRYQKEVVKRWLVKWKWKVNENILWPKIQISVMQTLAKDINISDAKLPVQKSFLH
ncbi:hypothetical protein HanHA300_Chr04g0148271 [Helianthus annuus]|nr:hypothetical protein HanHA300_Chr04g0148271 [Helianthus annuus]KAJ0598065.1 hypothetical protein HanHA89_Chr04g0161661 [Helianthus annuus]